MPEGAPVELARIILRAMDRDPDGRFESAEQLRLALSGFLEHRGSEKLAEEAEGRLRELLAERASDSVDPDERRLRLYHLFGECRFGFLQSLRSWPNNQPAKQGLRRAVETMVEVELELGDSKAASLLLGELEEDAPTELLRRVAEARSAREVEEGARAQLARDFDPSIGRRTRAFVLVVLGLSWTVLPIIAYFQERGRSDLVNRRAVMVGMVVQLATAAALSFWARDSLSRTAINRRLVGTIGVALGAQLALLAASSVLGVEYRATRPILMLVHTVVCTLGALAMERRFWPSAVGFGVAFVLGCIAPDITYLFAGLANFGLTINVVVLWGRLREDVVNPLRERQEARRRRWQAFLARTREPASASRDERDHRT